MQALEKMVKISSKGQITFVVLRYLLADHEEHFDLAECVYVLLKVYRVPKRRIADILSAVLSLRGTVDPDVAAIQLRPGFDGRIGRNCRDSQPARMPSTSSLSVSVMY